MKPAREIKWMRFLPKRVEIQPVQAVTMVVPMMNEVSIQDIWSGAAEKAPCM